MPSALTDIVRHMLRSHALDLGISTNEDTWVRALQEGASLAPATSRNILLGPNARINDHTAERLAVFLRRAPGWQTLTKKWFYASNLQEFLDFQRKSTAASTTTATLKIIIEIPPPLRIDELEEEFCHHYVCYRYAFETASDHIAREVATITREGDHLAFAMSYKMGSDDRDEPVRMFNGYVLPLGTSLMCLATSTDAKAPPYDRGRCLFLRRNVSDRLDRRARFGILSSTRADGSNEPCAACVVLLRVLADIRAKDIDEFRQRATIIRPLKEIMANDFKKMRKLDQDAFKTFIDNRPRGVVPEQPPRNPDKVLKLWHERFASTMPSIVEHLDVTPALRAPCKRNWRKALLSPPLS